MTNVYIKYRNGKQIFFANGQEITEAEADTISLQNSVEELKHMIKFYGEHHGLTQWQVEQIFMAIYADESTVDHDAIEQMIQDFKAENAKKAG